MKHELSIAIRSAAFIVVTACTNGDDPVAGAGAGGAPFVEGVSPECERWSKAFSRCQHNDLQQQLERCLNFAPCQAEADAYWGCSAEALEKTCEESCLEYAGPLDYCMLTMATCEVQENSCSCIGEAFKPQNTFVACEAFDPEPAGGSGAGGGTGQFVQCKCGYGDTLAHVCQQDVLDCGLDTSCCWEF